MKLEFEKMYNEEQYLFEVIGPRFHEAGSLGAYELFAIVRWKANRSRTQIARSILKTSGESLERGCRRLTRDIYDAPTDRDRFFAISEKWKFRLPMASAILTVLFPSNFTVYDIRACQILGNFENLAQTTNVEKRWRGYLEFMSAVQRYAPANLCLRDQDRYIWAQSRHRSLEEFLDSSKA